MPTEIKLLGTISIRDAGLDEYWLQDQILENPACLGLGELEALAKERQQSSGGRLDILLKDPEDDSMYEVEVMLGETNETHIIRTIEYWDNEKRKFPKRKHFAVLVAEHINRRFFNVIHLLSFSIPIIAVQASLIETGNGRGLLFTTVLDTYEEADDGSPLSAGSYKREYWVEKAKPTLEIADRILELTKEILAKPQLNYLKNYIAISSEGYNYIWLHKRALNKSLMGFRTAQSLQDDAAKLLDENNISYVRKTHSIRLTIDRELLDEKLDLFTAIANIAHKSWEAGG